MNTIGNYFVNKMDDAISIKDNMVVGKNYRFTILTERLIRLEYSPSGKFEDRPTQRVIFRKFPKTLFNVSNTEMLLQISTTYFTLNYVIGKPFSSGKFSAGGNLKISLNNTDRVWFYGHPEARNFGGITYSLDNFHSNLKLDKGLYSTDGFSCIDDSNSLVMNSDGNFVTRSDKELDIYVFMYRKDFGLCLQDYYTLTGYPMMLPRYALGAWWYKNCKYDRETLDRLMGRFQEEAIPIAAVILGDKWHLDNDPLIMDDNSLSVVDLENLEKKYNVKAGLVLRPSDVAGVNSLTYKNVSNYVSGINKKGYSFLPLSNQSLSLYTNLGIGRFTNMGIDAFLIDYNNIKDKSSLALLSQYAYVPSSISLNKRAIVFSRNHDLAVHRNTVVFTGSTVVNWETLAMLPRFNMSASNNGVSFVANAIGGFYGGIENFELYIRYIQFGVFSSMLVLASEGSKYYKREPWRWNASEKSIIKKYLTLRNMLIPYLYTESYVYYKSGSPIVQPLYYKYPKIYDEVKYKNQYFFGSQMLVCPIIKRKNTIMNRVVQPMFIPKGIWYELESGKKYLGNKYYMSFYRDEDYPVFCKEGAIIPMSLDKTVGLPVNMEIIVVPGSDGSYTMYEDDGITNSYKNGVSALTEFNFKYQSDRYEFSIKVTSNSGILPDKRNYRVRFKNTLLADVSVSSGGSLINAVCRLEKNDLIIEFNDVSVSQEIIINCSGNGSIENSIMQLVNDDIKGILEDLEIETALKEKIGAILFADLSIKKKRIAIRKLKRAKLEPKFIKMFLNLLEYIKTV